MSTTIRYRKRALYLRGVDLTIYLVDRCPALKPFSISGSISALYRQMVCVSRFFPLITSYLSPPSVCRSLKISFTCYPIPAKDSPRPTDDYLVRILVAARCSALYLRINLILSVAFGSHSVFFKLTSYFSFNGVYRSPIMRRAYYL
jgi:hypothetical protein